MVNSFAIIGSRLAINCIEFWGVTPCNFGRLCERCSRIRYWTSCNFEMYCDLCAFPLWFKESPYKAIELRKKIEKLKI